MGKENFSFDVVIPSYRLQEQYIRPILKLEIPQGVPVHFILIADQPGIKLPEFLNEIKGDFQLTVIKNEKNEGASFSRNRGIESGSGDWIILLDDDILVAPDLLKKYAAAAKSFPEEIGFIGLVALPAVSTSFTKSIAASGAMDIFSIARHRDSFAWGATANIMFRRSAAGNIRFSPVFPKSGGGEDVDFFLKIRKANNYKNFKTVPAAVVEHPWWNNGQRDFGKPFRYGMGNSWLVQLNPEYAYRDWLNTPETILFLLIFILVIAAFQPQWLTALFLTVAGIITIEFLANLVQVQKRQKSATLIVVWYTMLIRLAQESGVLWGKLKRGRVDLIGLRFHDDGSRKKFSILRSNTYRIVKWILYPVLLFFILKYF